MNDSDVTRGRATERLTAAASRLTEDDGENVQPSLRESQEIGDVLTALVNLSLTNTSLEEQLQLVLKHVVSISWLALESKGAIFLVEGDPAVLVMRAQLRMAAPLLRLCDRVPFGACLCGRAAASKAIQYAACVDDRHDTMYPGISPHGHYCVPILLKDEVVGVLNFYIATGLARNEANVQFLRTVASVLAGIIERRRTEDTLRGTLAKLRSALGGAIQIAASLVERRDPYTAGHQRRVANLARAIATEMHLSEHQIDGLRLAAVVHDIGKVSVPAEILTYPGKLGEAEMAMIRRHPDIGYETLRVVQFPWPLAEIVRQHHERMNGSGYPQGLSGEQIMVEARVLGVADVIEAMASHRPYRPALSLDKALEEISLNAGVLYDPTVVDAILELHQEKRLLLDPCTEA